MRLNLERALSLNGKGISAALMSYVNITAESNFRYITQTGTKRIRSKI